MVLISISGWIIGILIVLIATVGVILLMLGIILKKRWQLLTGIFTLIATFILMIGSLVFFASQNKNSEDISEYDENSLATLEKSLSESQPSTENISSESASSCISGHIKDADNSLTYIRIYPNESLLNNGIKVKEIETYYKTTSNKGKPVTLQISFDREVHEKIKMILFSDKNIEIGSSTVQVDQTGANDMNITFYFDNTAPFEIADHATLDFSN